MTQAKGISVKNLYRFVKSQGDENFIKWLNALSPEAKKVYSLQIILESKWFPAKEINIEPNRIAAEMFFSDPDRGAWDIGRFHAENILKGVYKYILAVASPSYLISKAAQITSGLYQPTRMEIKEKGENHATVALYEFPEIDKAMELSIGGWMERALEICNCQNIKIEICKSIAKGDECTEYTATWHKK